MYFLIAAIFSIAWLMAEWDGDDKLNSLGASLVFGIVWPIFATAILADFLVGEDEAD
jgi:hypothetical protein